MAEDKKPEKHPGKNTEAETAPAQKQMALFPQYQEKIQELVNLNDDLTNVLHATTTLAIFLDAQLCVRRFTPTIVREVNLSDSDIGSPLSHISHNIVGADLSLYAEEALQSLVPIESEVQSHSGKWYLLKYTPYRTKDNIVKGVVISLVDITAQKEAEAALRKNTLRYERLVELSPFAILVARDAVIHFVNTEGAKLFQAKNAGELVGRSIHDYMAIDLTQLAREQKDQAPLEGQVLSRNGSAVDVEIMSISVQFEEESELLMILQDVSYRKITEQIDAVNAEKQHAARLLEEAKAYVELKNDFFSNLSHELRTPLNVIMSCLQLLEIKIQKGQTDGGGMAKYMGMMRQNCYRQLRLINNMIDITKIDTGFFDVNMQNHDIAALVGSIIESVSEYIRAKAIDLTYHTDMQKKIIACDPDNMERIILNLLSNAVKFTPEGGSISVSLSQKGKTIRISVKDTGIGIPKDKLDVIFERFRQVDKSLARNQEGSGIGLSLVKSLVEMHGGSIRVRSQYRHGAEFIIDLPTVTVAEEATVEENPLIQEINRQSRVEKINLEFSDIYNTLLSG